MEQTIENMEDVLLGLFTEVAIIEHLARTRIERKYPDGPGAGHFGILNYFIRNHEGPDTIGGIAWSFQEDENHTADKVTALGTIVFERMPCSPPSSAMTLLRPSSPAFDMP